VKYFFLFLFLPALGWGETAKSFKLDGSSRASIEYHALLKVAQEEVGEALGPQMKALRLHTDALLGKSPFGKESGAQAFFEAYLLRKNITKISLKNLTKSKDKFFAEVEVSYDPLALKDFFREQERKVSKIYLVDEYEIQGFTWEDMALKDPENFFRPIADSWQRALNGIVDDAEICDRECLGFYQTWLSQSEAELKSYPEDFYFLNISLLIQRPLHDPKVKEVTFSWNGRVHSSSFANKDRSKTLEVPPESGKWLTHDQKDVNSRLAHRIYQSGTLPLKSSIEALQNLSQNQNSFYLNLNGLKTVDESMRFIQYLKKRDPDLKLKAEIDSLVTQGLRLKCTFAGEEKRFTDLLKSIKGLKLSRSYKIEINLGQGDHTLKFLPN
jgi:hypothetical protein